MCVLNKHEIEKLCKENELLKPYDLKRIKYASYDLTVGEEYRLSHEKEMRKISKNGVVEIPPNGVCFVLAEERVKLPNDVCAFIFSRHRAVKEGFLMHPQPPFDPGYEGAVYVLFHNLTSETVRIERGEHLATIVFLKVSPSLKEVYGSDKDEDKYIGMKSLENIVGDRVYTSALKEVSDRVLNWKESLISKYMPITLVVITVILMILTILLMFKVG